jgi:NAD(P)-dependent dehydrogenase (short-subunit alcohol dehydrogenase family)
MTLSGRVALVTGGRRIGGPLAVELARRGADVALAYRRSAEEAEQVAAEIRAFGRRALVVQADLSQASDCQALVEHTASGLGRLDVLINMASVYVSKPFDDLTEADWDTAMAVDGRSAFLCARAAVPHMRRAGGGRIINFSDWVAASRRPRYRGYLPYYVAKMAVIGLTEALALELAGDGILVNAVAPGPILPPPDLDDEGRRAVERSTPLGHWGGTDEIVKAVLALVDSDFITGETIRVDGGRHLR